MKIMVDLFHMQILNGNIINWLKENKEWVGHVQVILMGNSGKSEVK
jgi:hydroxypyruvate isomerase